ncbi:alpha/beta hydrolase [Candidatus Saccharibacteria bacterium]|nr:alpha/beta hydrolase [Candidatus Saccharibacteria bacterium]
MTTIYIIHGWTYTVDPWDRTIKELKANGIKVEMLHVPGLTAPSNKVWTIEDYVKWADKNIPKDAIVLGHSNGGRILLNLLSKKPDKVKHLILVDAAGIYEDNKKRDLSRKVSKTFAPLKKIKPFRKVYHKLLGASDYDRAPENMKKTLSNMLESDKSLDIKKVTTPTTILWGKKDTITPPSQAEKMHELLPNSTLNFYANWSHAPYISDPSGFARALTKTVKNITGVDTSRSLASQTGRVV